MSCAQLEERVVPDISPYMAIGLIIAFILVVILLLYSTVGD